MLFRSARRLARFSRQFEAVQGDAMNIPEMLNMKRSEETPALSRENSGPGLTIFNKGELEFKPYLVLKSRQNIEDYVIAVVRNYFRTTYKNGLGSESTLAEHGLDSLDAVELAMQIEDDLGYNIATETLSNFHSVKHYVNYIGQVEEFKATYKREPLA